ncbi:DUF1852 domain-containing protein [Paracoccus aminophilus]|nr:DUF1852 domain-containing protein [Paracoccus aminophilus]
MRTDLTYSLKSTRFDENYRPAENTRTTTNFANLARGSRREENLRNTFKMIDNRFNALAHWDNPGNDRYSVELEIISAEISIGDNKSAEAFPLIEILKPTILDRKNGQRIEGIAGNNFSSYVRDYDFSILLPQHNDGRSSFSAPAHFGDLHGNLFRFFLKSPAYKETFKKLPVICLSVSSSKTYQRTENTHPVLGVEYRQDAFSATDLYFEKMGLQVRYFMPPNSVAPLAFYFTGDLLSDYSCLELIGTISTMETFQRIYRPEIYNANSIAGKTYQPSLKHQDYSLTQIAYDRDERSRLAIEQGQRARDTFIEPYREILEKWSSQYSA